jgi:hypothetical protein
MFEIDRSKIPKIILHKSILDMYDENYVTYRAGDSFFERPGDKENIVALEKEIYELIAWYEHIKTCPPRD